MHLPTHIGKCTMLSDKTCHVVPIVASVLFCPIISVVGYLIKNSQ